MSGPTNIFDLNDVYQIQIPVNGKMEFVERIRNEQGKILWQVHRANVKFRDNIPVSLTYDINIDGNTQQYMYLIPDGNITTYDNTMSGFSSLCYAHTPIDIDWRKNTSFELCLKITTGANVSQRQELFSMSKTESIELEILNNKLHWEKMSVYGKTKLKSNTTYFVKFIKNNTSVVVQLSEDGGLTYVNDIVSTADFTVTGEAMHFGIDKVCGSATPIEPFLGIIDLNQSTFTYNNVKYLLRIVDEGYITLVRDGSIRVVQDANGQHISNFSSKNHAHTPFFINWSTTNETTIVMNITTGANVTSRQELFGMQTVDNFELEIHNGKLKWELTDTWSSNQILPNTNYLIEFKKAKTKYEVSAYNAATGQRTAYITATSTRTCKDEYLYLGVDKQNNGIEAFNGTIHCNGSYIKYNNKTFKFRI